MSFFSYIKSKTFFTHLALASLSVVVVVWLLIKSLSSYTHHGETAVVPDFKGKFISELNAFVVDKNVGYTIIDSIYDPKEKPGMVIRQEPDAKSEVKHNRTIYLYVTSTQAPKIAMPKLVDRSTRQAVLMIESYGLKVGNIKEVKADCKGCVLKQFYNGKEIAVSAPIQKGSKIDLEVGKKENEYIPVIADSTATADFAGDEDRD